MPHTPGPWTVEDAMCGDKPMGYLHVMQSENSFRGVADITHCYNGDRDHEMEKANARLIAAAPDLLAACQQAYDEVGPSLHLSRDTYWECESCKRQSDSAATLTHTSGCLWKACEAAIAHVTLPNPPEPLQCQIHGRHGKTT
jgi:hypothetical protein